MKKLLMIAILAASFSANAQDTHKREKAKLTPEQRTELRVKEMTLELDLTDAQQSELSRIFAEQSSKRQKQTAERKETREARKEFTSDERFAYRKAMLDERIAMKARIKQVLTPEQFARWESKRGEMRSKHAKRFKMKKQSKKMDKK